MLYKMIYKSRNFAFRKEEFNPIYITYSKPSPFKLQPFVGERFEAMLLLLI